MDTAGISACIRPEYHMHKILQVPEIKYNRKLSYTPYSLSANHSTMWNVACNIHMSVELVFIIFASNKQKWETPHSFAFGNGCAVVDGNMTKRHSVNCNVVIGFLEKNIKRSISVTHPRLGNLLFLLEFKGLSHLNSLLEEKDSHSTLQHCKNRWVEGRGFGLTWQRRWNNLWVNTKRNPIEGLDSSAGCSVVC